MVKFFIITMETSFPNLYTEDEISTYAENSADEETDLTRVSATSKKTDKEKKKNLSTDNLKLLDNLAKSLSEDNDSTSPNAESKLADITMKRWGGGGELTSDKLKKITDKYHREANCTNMAGIRCNSEIWNQLSFTTKITDIQLSHIQQVVLEAVFATCKQQMPYVATSE